MKRPTLALACATAERPLQLLQARSPSFRHGELDPDQALDEFQPLIGR
jgi:hypothetical protein